ncbi:MAG TPA: DUF5689 domain-containing protein [Bacteroidia bacterium]|nr:DUF5689 domain-containing protein [Bacteroidia bacterium]
MTKKNVTLFAILTLVFVVVFSCKKDYKPVEPTPIATGPAVTIAQLRAMYTGQSIKFTSNTSLYAVVTMDETSGNIFKQVYLRDGSGSAITSGYGAICMRQTSSGGLYQGDSVRINLNGATLDMSNGGSLQIDSVNVIKQVAKIKTGLNPLPIVVTMPQITTAFDGQLVQLYGVEFIQDNVGSTYAIPQIAPALPVSVNRFINDCAGNEMVAYNSGYANFAGQVIPNANGSIVAIANLYSTMQLTLRSYADINLNSAYCPIILDTMNQNFTTAALSDKKPVFLAGWKNIAYEGSIKWNAATWGTSPFTHLSPAASNYKSVDARNDMWLISPPIMYAGGGVNKYLNFSTGVQYPNGNRQLSVLVSGSFDGTNIIPSQWTDLSTTLFPYIAINNTPPNFRWASNSQPDFSNQPLVGFVPPNNSGTFYIAFRYQSNQNDSNGLTCLINKVIIRNHP